MLSAYVFDFKIRVRFWAFNKTNWNRCRFLWDDLPTLRSCTWATICSTTCLIRYQQYRIFLFFRLAFDHLSYSILFTVFVWLLCFILFSLPLLRTLSLIFNIVIISVTRIYRLLAIHYLSFPSKRSLEVRKHGNFCVIALLKVEESFTKGEIDNFSWIYRLLHYKIIRVTLRLVNILFARLSSSQFSHDLSVCFPICAIVSASVITYIQRAWKRAITSLFFSFHVKWLAKRVSCPVGKRRRVAKCFLRFTIVFAAIFFFVISAFKS